MLYRFFRQIMLSERLLAIMVVVALFALCMYTPGVWQVDVEVRLSSRIKCYVLQNASSSPRIIPVY